MKSSEFAGTGILAAPSARRKAHVSTWHGIELADDFAWLRAENWQEVMREPERLDPEIRAYLDAENAYTNSVMAPTQPLQGAHSQLPRFGDGHARGQDPRPPWQHCEAAVGARHLHPR